MRKILLSSFLLSATLFCLTSCNSLCNIIDKSRESIKEIVKEEIKNNIKFPEKEKFLEILEALENKDEDALKAVLSEEAISKAENLDEGIKSFIDLYQGTHIGYEITTPFSGGSWENGWGTHYRIDVNVELTTEIDSYRIVFHYHALNEDDPKTVGVSCLQIMKKSYFYSKSFKGSDALGIYALTENLNK